MIEPRICLALLPLLLAAGCATTESMRAMDSPAEWRAAMQPPLPEEVAAQLAADPELAQAVRLAAERNPAAAAARKRWLAQINVEPQEVTPPDPMLQFGYQFESLETRVGPQEWNIGLNQQIPWPQKLWARGRVAASGADIAQLQYEAALRDVIIDVKNAWYELYFVDQALEVLTRLETLLQKDALLAYSELTVGRTQLNEAFRAESQAAQLGYDRILLTELRAAQAERLKALMNAPPDTVIGPVDAAPAYEVSGALDDLYARAEAYAEVLQIRGLEAVRASYRSYLARLSYLPDPTLGFNYISMGEAGPMPGSGRTYAGPAGTTLKTSPQPPEDSGTDPFIGLFSANLPIYVWRNQALVREREALEEAMQLDAMAELNDVRAAVAQAYFRVQLTERLIVLYKETLLPQARAVLDQSEIFYRNEQAAFSGVLETTAAYENFLLAHLRAIADHGQAIGELERVLGTTAAPRPDVPVAYEEIEAEEAEND